MSGNDRTREQLERHLRQASKQVSYEEQKRRKNASRMRHSTRNDSGARKRGWTEADDEEPGFERIVRARHEAAASPVDDGPIDASLARSTVVAVHRGRVVLDDEAGGEREARLAGRLAANPDLQLVVGDEVAWSEHSGVARIEAVVPRRSSLSRTDPGNPHRLLPIAANVDVAVIVAAAVDPPLRPGLIDRYLLGLERGGVEAVACINKVDLLTTDAERAELEALLRPYTELDLPLVRVSASTGDGVEGLRDLVRGRTCVFVGHSGVGKSSLLNALDPSGGRAVGAVRDHRGEHGGRGGGRGRHTTTSSSLRELGDGTRVIDTPGVRAFGLEHLAPADVLAGFPDLEAFAADCRFSNCAHAEEPGCGVRAAVEAERVAKSRYTSYRRIVDSV